MTIVSSNPTRSAPQMAQLQKVSETSIYVKEMCEIWQKYWLTLIHVIDQHFRGIWYPSKHSKLSIGGQWSFIWGIPGLCFHNYAYPQKCTLLLQTCVRSMLILAKCLMLSNCLQWPYQQTLLKVISTLCVRCCVQTWFSVNNITREIVTLLPITHHYVLYLKLWI